MLSKNLDLWARSVRVGSVFWFKGPAPFPANRDIGHHFVVVGLDREREEVYYLVNGTSQVSRWRANIHRTLKLFPEVDPATTYVVAPAGSTPFFPLETMLNCNEVHKISLTDLKNGEFAMVTPSYLDEADIHLLYQVLQAVVASPMVSDRAKADAKNLLNRSPQETSERSSLSKPGE